MAAGDRPPSSLLVMRIVHAAITVSIGMYAVVLSNVSGQDRARPNGPPDLDVLTYVFMGISAVELAIVFLVLRPRLLPPWARTGRAEALAGPAPEPGAAARQAIARYVVLSIIGWAITESVAIYGLILGFLKFEMKPFLPFAGVAVAALLLQAPRKAHVDAIARGAPPT